MTETNQSRVVGESLSVYLPALDGLRFFAFLLVFMLHLAPAPSWLSPIADRGWLGVELFFVISAYLFFRLFAAEQRAAGRISPLKFYVRRFLRLYPLMVAYPTILLLMSGDITRATVARLAGLWFLSDNFLCWIRGFNPIFLSSHLWTLSYEFQLYLVLPLAFLLYAMIGRRSFLWCLLAMWILSLGANCRLS